MHINTRRLIDYYMYTWPEGQKHQMVVTPAVAEILDTDVFSVAHFQGSVGS